MKQIIALLLSFILCLSLSACNENKKAFEASKAAYENIDTAYQIVKDFGSDIYEAWRLGIYDEDEILDDGAKHLAAELSLSVDEIRAGAAYAIVTLYGLDWFSLTEEKQEEYISNADLYFVMREDSLFSFCVWTVSGAYKLNGKVDEAQSALDSAKTQMKELSQKYSDYEHYPNLKGYYTTTSSFFDFCQNPSGSFEQVKETINKYNNEARDYISDLDYIFED